jgi:FkbM family methyltransferase
MEIYGENQAEILFDYWPEKAEWFVLGGVGTSNEAQTIHARYPAVKCVGFEPSREMRVNRAPDFPGVIHPHALWDKDVELVLSVPARRHISGSVVREFEDKFACEYYPVPARTLDSLAIEFGPWPNCVLWIDIEWAELSALRGATKLLKDVLLINLEVMTKEQDKDIAAFLSKYGFREVKRWGNTMPDKWDVIFERIQSHEDNQRE